MPHSTSHDTTTPDSTAGPYINRRAEDLNGILLRKILRLEDADQRSTQLKTFLSDFTEAHERKALHPVVSSPNPDTQWIEKSRECLRENAAKLQESLASMIATPTRDVDLQTALMSLRYLKSYNTARRTETHQLAETDTARHEEIFRLDYQKHSDVWDAIGLEEGKEIPPTLNLENVRKQFRSLLAARRGGSQSEASIENGKSSSIVHPKRPGAGSEDSMHSDSAFSGVSSATSSKACVYSNDSTSAQSGVTGGFSKFSSFIPSSRHTVPWPRI